MHHSHTDTGNGSSPVPLMECSKSLANTEFASTNGILDHGHGSHHHSHSISISPPSPMSPISGHSHSHSLELHANSLPQGVHRHSHSHPLKGAPAIVFSDLHDNSEHHDLAPVQRHLSLLSPSQSSKDGLSPPSPGAELQHMLSPITPRYTFGHDEHFKQHGSEHAPNLHDHSHSHSHGEREGHSHNMRGVFLHVMAVCLVINISVGL